MMTVDPDARFEQDRLLMQNPAVSATDRQAAVLRQAFWQARYQRVRHSDLPADLFLGAWTNLLLHVTGSRWRLPLKKIRRDLDHFFERPLLAEAMRIAGDQAGHFLQAELDDSAVLYFSTCRKDERYSSLLFGLMKLKDEQVAAKSAAETIDGFVRPLLLLGDSSWRCPMLNAVCKAYPAVFPEYAGHFMSRLNQLDQEMDGKVRDGCQILE